jgi:hypothetical protein
MAFKVGDIVEINEVDHWGIVVAFQDDDLVVASTVQGHWFEDIMPESMVTPIGDEGGNG